jgi:hypothetical protein
VFSCGAGDDLRKTGLGRGWMVNEMNTLIEIVCPLLVFSFTIYIIQRLGFNSQYPNATL